MYPQPEFRDFDTSPLCHSEIAEPHDQPATPPSASSGLDWDILAVIGDAPARSIPVIIKAALQLRHAPSLRLATAQLAARLKITETSLVAAAAAIPQLFRISGKGTILHLLTEKPDPWDLDEKGYARLQKEHDKQQRAFERADHRQKKDAEDTPFNKLRADLELLGLMREDARKFAGFLFRTYGLEAAQAHVEQAKLTKPAEPRGYIIAALKRSVSAPGLATAAGASGRARTVRATQRPDPLRETKFIGWESSLLNGTRHKLYRMPDGRLKRMPPADDENVPSLGEDPGYTVIE